MNFARTLSLALCALSVAPLAEARTSLPVTIENGFGLELSGVHSEIDEGVVSTSGWVRRRLGSFGSINAHLHVALLGADGQAIQTIDARWTGTPSHRVRNHHIAIFRARAPQPEGTEVAGVRVTVERGARHASD